MGKEETGRQQTATYEFLRTVDIRQDDIEQPRPLQKCFLQPFPLARGNDERHQVEAPLLGGRVRIGIKIVRKSGVVDLSIKTSCPCQSLAWRQIIKRRDQRGPMRSHFA